MLDYLLFEDWIAREEHRATDWITVARNNSGEHYQYFTTASALLPDDPDLIQLLFTETTWGFTLGELGSPGYNDGENGPEYFPDAAGMGQLPFRAFTLYRSFHLRYESYFELLQEFVMYHNAHFDEKYSAWISFDEAGSDVQVARKLDVDGFEQLQVSTHALREFLTSGPWVLVRCHDGFRSVDSCTFPDGEDTLYAVVQDERRFYDVTAREARPPMFERPCARLLGFDIVRPYEQVPTRYRFWDSEDEPFVTFIIGTDESGRDIEYTCDEHELGNHFVQSDAPHFLTSTYFRPEVLEKYHNDPERYHGGPGVPGLWDIPIAINEEGLVHVWLGDLGRIPYTEQQHWRQHNVRPSGGITEERYQQDFMARATVPRDPSARLKNAVYQVNDISAELWGFTIFQPLTGDDEHTVHSIVWPIPDRQNVFDDRLIDLSKFLCDSIDVAGLKGITGQGIDKDAGINGANDLLEFSLRHVGCDDATVGAVMEPLRLTQRLRSSGAGHRRGSNFAKAMAAAGFDRLTLSAAYEQLLEQLCASAKCLAEFLQTLK